MTIPDDVDEQALAWLTRLHSGQCSWADRRAARSWRRDHPDHERAYREAEDMWAMASALDVDSCGRIVPKTTRKPPSRLAPLAAMAAAILLGLIGAASLEGWPPAALADVATRDTIDRMTLEDGSQLSMDTHTAADIDFTAQARVVTLRRGSLFVRVAPAPDRPFTVKAGSVSVTALGTAFEVARASDDTVQIGVAEHSVAVSWPNGETVTVAQGHRLTVRPDGQVGPATAVDPVNVAAWRDYRLVAENSTLGSIAASLSAHSSGWILVDDRLAERRVNAVLDLGDTAGALRALQAAIPMEIRGVDGWVTVLRERN